MERADQLLSKLPPQAPDAEKSLLGALLLDGDRLPDVAAILKAEDFYATAHQKLFEALLALMQRGSRVDAVLLKEEMRQRGELEAIGGESYLLHLVEMVPSAAGAEDYARVVKEKSSARALIHLCTELQTAAYEGSAPGDNLLDFAESRIFALSSTAADQGVSEIRDVLMQAFADIETIRRRGGQLTGLATPFFELDEMTSGFQPGELIIVAGRPSMGKTTFANCCMSHAAIVEKQPAVSFSLEVSASQVVRNLLCSHSRVDAQKVKRGTLSDDEFTQLQQGASELHEAPIFIDDNPTTSVLQVRAKARRIKQKHGLGMLVVDYLQLMEGNASSENRQQEIAQISRSLKNTARELQVPVIAISQLNRSVDTREDRRPRMSDLRESGSLEQDADLILFLFREEYYKQTPENQGLAEVIVAKQRNGPTGTVGLRFFGEHLRFENLAYNDNLSW